MEFDSAKGFFGGTGGGIGGLGFFENGFDGYESLDRFWFDDGIGGRDSSKLVIVHLAKSKSPSPSLSLPVRV